MGLKQFQYVEGMYRNPIVDYQGEKAFGFRLSFSESQVVEGAIILKHVYDEERDTFINIVLPLDLVFPLRVYPYKNEDLLAINKIWNKFINNPDYSMGANNGNNA